MLELNSDILDSSKKVTIQSAGLNNSESQGMWQAFVEDLLTMMDHRASVSGPQRHSCPLRFRTPGAHRRLWSGWPQRRQQPRAWIPTTKFSRTRVTMTAALGSGWLTRVGSAPAVG